MNKVFVDASAIVAIAIEEADWRSLFLRISNYGACYTSALSVWEATVAISRFNSSDISISQNLVNVFIDNANFEILKIDHEIGILAIQAFDKYGKGRHKAALNFGDCFSYACAKHHKMPLLYKGDDFTQTDIEIA